MRSDSLFRTFFDSVINSSESVDGNILGSEIAIKLENETSIKSEPKESEEFYVHETIFEDVNRQFFESTEVVEKRKHKKRNALRFDVEYSGEVPKTKPLKRGRKPKSTEDKIAEDSLYCELCKQFFTTKNSLQKHIKIKHEFVDLKDQYSCDYCGKNFLIKYYLIRHIKVRHFKEEAEKAKTKITDSPIPCEICGKILKNRGLLKPHMRSHQKMTPDDYYYCDLCPRKFKTRGGCTWHIQQRHILKTSFKCPQCPAVYRGKWELKCHVKSKHTNIRDFRCEICGKGFLDRYLFMFKSEVYTTELIFPKI